MKEKFILLKENKKKNSEEGSIFFIICVSF